MLTNQLKTFLESRRCTLLGVGPMSTNIVDVVIDIANKHEIPIMLIASRRQVDSEVFGGGYVNNWTTETFAQYVNKRDKKGKILLSRDHGGPWQNTQEQNSQLGLRSAMDSAKASFRADIEAGFQVLHIDPSIDIHTKPDIDTVLDRLFELYDFCWSHAQKSTREVIFEVGTEEQSGSTNSQAEMDYCMGAINNFCSRNKLPHPTFVVVQCGTRVMEMQNVGSFDSPIRIADEIPVEIQLPKMIEICNNHGIFMKEHNADYLSDESLQWHPRLGIHAANVAPEFGVAETKALLTILESNGLTSHAERFLQVSYDSRKWSKWMLDNSCASDRDRAIIAGHYNFSADEVVELKEDAATKLKSKGIDLSHKIKEEISISIYRYLHCFRIL